MDMTDDAVLADLDAFVCDVFVEVDGFGNRTVLDPDPIPVEDEAAANRMLRAVARLDADEAKLRRVADDEIARIRAFVDDRTAGIAARRRWIERSMEGWLAGQPDDVRTVKLPNGELRRRPPAQRVVAFDVDDGSIEEIAAVAPDVVRTKREVDKVAAKAELRVGPVIDGAVVEPGYEAHQAVTAGGEVVPHVVFWTAAPGAAVFGYKAVPR